MFYFSLGAVSLIFVASLFLRGRFLNGKFAKYSFCFSLLAVFIFLLGMSVNQFFEWKQNELSSYLLPPYQSIDYFIYYCFNRFFAAYAISAIISFLFLFSASFLNKKCGECFFEPEEPYFGALAIFLTAWPGFLVYIVFLVFIYFLIHLYSLFVIHDSSKRFSLYYLWLPASLFAIIINNFSIQNIAVWQALKV